MVCIMFAMAVMAAMAANAIEVADTKITGIMVYSEGIVQVTKEGTVCCGSEFYTSIEGNVLPRSLRVLSGSFDIEYISLSVRDEARLERPLTMLDLVNQSLNKKVDFVTDYGYISGLLYRLEGDLLFLSNVKWVKDNKTLKYQFFTMKVSDIQNMLSYDKPVFEPVYHVSETSITQPTYYDSYYNNMLISGRDKKISWKDNGEGSRNVSIVYRSDGVSWEPIYHLDIIEGDSSARFGFWAKISNDLGASLDDVEVGLVAGNIRLLENRYRYGMEYMNAAQSALGNIMNVPDAVIGAAISALEEYEVYHLGKTSLDCGETKLVKVFDKTVNVERDFVWDARSTNTWDAISENGKVHNIYRLVNEENSTWPYGSVSVYRDLMFVGEDTISWTPNGREAKVTVGYAPDIEVKKRVTVKEVPESRWDNRYTATLKMINYKNEKITLTVIDSFPRNAENFKSNLVYIEKPGNLIYWNITLGPGEKKDLIYEYVVD